MLTRAEELQNLREMKTRIDSIIMLQKKIELDEENIKKQRERAINDDYPEYVPSDYYQKAQLTTAKASLVISYILILLELCLGIASVIYFFTSALITGWLHAIAFLALYYVPFGFAITSFPNRLWILLLHLVFALLGWYSNVFYISFGLIIIIIIWILIGDKICLTKKDKERLAEAISKDKDHRRTYEEKKKSHQLKIQAEKKKLAKEVEQKIAEYNEKINKNKALIYKESTHLQAIPGLADQDKNEYTVNKLIAYFERGKADSIKEAINLFDSEERENERDRKEREQQSAWYRIMLEEHMRADKEHKELIEKQDEENRRRYNDLKRLENERTEKVDEFIKEVKRKLDE